MDLKVIELLNYVEIIIIVGINILAHEVRYLCEKKIFDINY